MKKINISFRTFRTKVTLVLILSMLFVGALSNYLVYTFALKSQFSEIRKELMLMAQTAALFVDAETIQQVPLNQGGRNTVPFITIEEQLKRIRVIDPMITFIYTMKKTDTPGTWQFIVDPDLPNEEELEEDITSYPGDTYDASRFPEMMKAFDGPAADTQLEVDEWGATISGYAPILDNNGKAVAMLGVDVSADNLYSTQQEVHKRALFVLGIGIILSLIVAFAISQRISKPIEKLVDASSRIADGDLGYRVEIKGDDEISVLAKSFNEMAEKLRISRKKLYTYFYRVLQSLVLIIEARDHYTKGHSEKVAEHSSKIAAKMGFTLDKVELVREMALVHDIGKLGIKESILNKKEKLTEEEWNIIKQHPVIGGEILKPILINKEMLDIVTGHHERYDGKGYPDKLSGEEINTLTAILSVADAYDAMTADRAYRAGLGKEVAIEQLKANKGTQFNPRIVDVFLKILEREAG
ncbi:HD domain-containing phosphohydrolase [Candidatus Omnitrophota bacterium]